MKKCNRILSVMAVVVPSVASAHRQIGGGPARAGAFKSSPLGGRAGLKPTRKRAAGAGAVCAEVLVCCNNAS